MEYFAWNWAKGPGVSLSEGRNQISGRGNLDFLHKKHNWKILGVGNNWVWKELVQAQNTVLEEKGKGEIFCLKIALTDLNRVLFFILSIYYL